MSNTRYSVSEETRAFLRLYCDMVKIDCKLSVWGRAAHLGFSQPKEFSVKLIS